MLDKSAFSIFDEDDFRIYLPEFRELTYYFNIYITIRSCDRLKNRHKVFAIFFFFVRQRNKFRCFSFKVGDHLCQFLQSGILEMFFSFLPVRFLMLLIHEFFLPSAVFFFRRRFPLSLGTDGCILRALYNARILSNFLISRRCCFFLHKMRFFRCVYRSLDGLSITAKFT